MTEVEIQKILASDGDDSDNFGGYGVAIDGDLALVMAFTANNNSDGKAYVFRRTNGVWTEWLQLVSSDYSLGRFGYDVDIDEESMIAVVGATRNSNGGVVYVYDLNNASGTISETATLLASQRKAGDDFGLDVAVDGYNVIVGAPGTGTYANGAAYVYDVENVVGIITETATLRPSDNSAFDFFGKGVAIDGDFAVVGAYGNGDNGSNSGSAYVFNIANSFGLLNEVAKLLPSDGASNNFFGWTIDMEDNNVVVGSYQEAYTNAVGVYYFDITNANGTTNEVSKLVPSNIVGYEYPGYVVSISNNTIVTGAYGDRTKGTKAGAIYVYDVATAVGIVHENSKILAPDGEANDYFGESVAIDGNTIFVGAKGDDDNGVGAGAVYVVTLPSTNNAPTLDQIGDQIVNEGQTLTFTVSATDPDGDNLTYAADNLPPGSSFDPETATFAWTPGFGDAGNYPDVEFAVMDDGEPMELDVEFITITVGNVNRPPVIDNPGPQEVLETETLIFDVTATDPDGDVVTVAASGTPAGATFDGVTFTWTPTLSEEGVYMVTFIATDNGAPSEVGELAVVVTVGDNPTPTEQAEDLVEDVVSIDIPQNVENSYLANLRKVEQFILDGKITAAINQLNAFINKVEQDYLQGLLSQGDSGALLAAANKLIADLTN